MMAETRMPRTLAVIIGVVLTLLSLFYAANAAEPADYDQHAATGHKHHPHHHDVGPDGNVLDGLAGVDGNPDGKAPQIEFVGEPKIEVWAEVLRAGKTMKPVGIGDMVQFHWDAFAEYHAGLSQIVGDMEYRKEQYFSSRTPPAEHADEGVEAPPVMMRLAEDSALAGFPDFINHITKMHLGDFVVLHIPHQLGYGEDGNELLGIPPKVDILIHVEVMGLAQSPENRKKFLEQPLRKKSEGDIAARKAAQKDGL